MTNLFARRPRSRISRWSLRICIALALYTIVGFLVIPAIIKSQLLKRLPVLTKRQAAIESIQFNPYVLSLTIHGLSLEEADGSVFVGFDRLYVNLQLSSILHRGLVLRELTLEKPAGQIVRFKDHTFNFANLMPAASQTTATGAAPGAPPPMLIYNLCITNGAITFSDQSRPRPFSTRIAPIDISLTNLATIRDKNSPYSFIARTAEGESFSWSGNLSLVPLASKGRFSLDGIPIPKYAGYAEDFSRVEIADGKIKVSGGYVLNSASNVLDLELTNGAVALTSLDLRDPDTHQSVVAIPSISISGIDASLARRSVHVRAVKSVGGNLSVSRLRDGNLNLLSYLVLPPASSNHDAIGTAPTPFSAKIDEIGFSDYAISIHDQVPAKAAAFKIDNLELNLKDFSNAANSPVDVSLSMLFQKTGLIALKGSILLQPLSADLSLQLTNLDIGSIQPYLDSQMNLSIASGTCDLAGKATFAPGNPMSASFAGSMAINALRAVDSIRFQDFVKWNKLNLDGIQFSFPGMALQMDQLKVSGLNTSLIVGPDNVPNFVAVFGKSSAPAEAPKASRASPILPEVSLNTMLIENASLRFADESISPHCSFGIEDFGGSIRNLSTTHPGAAEIDVAGKVDARSPFRIDGKANPFAKPPSADISVSFTNTELTSFSPYTEKYAGRPLTKGKLSFGVHYLLDRMSLKAENGFYVDQLTLGPRNDSSDATHLPVKLAIALLKDRSGRIKLDIPVAGRMDDPKFRIAPIIWQVVVNLMIKAATSPFSLLGAAFGGGEELSYVDFLPGTADFDASSTGKLDTLAKALYERPSVTLEITGSVDPAADQAALALRKLKSEITARWRKELSLAGANQPDSNQSSMDEQQYARFLRSMYVETFGLITNVETVLPAAGQQTKETAVVGQKQARQKDETKPGGNRAAQSAFPFAGMHGGQALLARSSITLLQEPRAEKSSEKMSASQPPAAALSPSVLQPATASEPSEQEMESRLVSRIVISDQDFLDLTAARANKVQSALLQGEKVTADRLFIVTPKLPDPSVKGAPRANMTLN